MGPRCTGDEEERGPGVDPCYAPAVVVETLPGVDGAGDEEKEGECDGCAVVRCIPVEGAFHCGVLVRKEQRMGSTVFAVCSHFE